MHAHRTRASLYAVLRARKWLEDGPKWQFYDVPKGMKTLFGDLACIDPIRLLD